MTVGKRLLPAVDYFLQVLQQVAAGTGAGMAAKREMVQEIHLPLQAVVGKDLHQQVVQVVLLQEHPEAAGLEVDLLEE